MGVLISSSIESFIQLIGVLFIFVFVLLITYFTTKWMGNIQRGRLTSNNLRVLETIAIGNGKLICLIETGHVYLVVSVGKDNPYKHPNRDTLSFFKDMMYNPIERTDEKGCVVELLGKDILEETIRDI